MGLNEIDPYGMIDFAEWQTILDILSRMSGTKSAAITKIDFPYIQVLKISASPEAPLYEGMNAELLGHYCEGVFHSQDKVMVTNARLQERWKNAPEISHGLISYLGYPVFLPNGEIFGTLCIHNDQDTEYSKEINDLMYQFKRVVEAHLKLAELTKQHKESEEALRSSETRFRKLIENSPDAIFVQTQERFAYLNSAALRLFGAQNENDLLGKPVMERLDPDCHEDIQERMHRINNEKKQAPRWEEVYQKLDGTPIEVEVSSVPICYEGQDGALVFARNISERKQLEMALKESEQRYKNLFNTSPDAIGIIDEEGTFLTVNVAMAERFDLSQQELQGKNYQDVMPPALARKRLRYGKQALELSRLTVFEDEREGRYLQNYYLPIFESGPKNTFLIISRDITERKHSEEELRRWENYYRTIFETSGSAMFISEEDTTISLANSNFEHLSGYSREEIEGKKSWTNFAHPDDIARMKENHYLRLQDPDAAPRQYEFRFITRSGEIRNTLLAVDMISETHQSIVSCIDITEQKRTEIILQSRLYLMEYSTTHSFEDILKATIEEAEKLTESRIGFYHFLQEDQKTLSLQAWSFRTNEECTALPHEEHYTVDEAGVWVDCIRRGEPVIHNDYPSLPHKKGVPHGHPSILRELVVPIYKGNTIIAMLGVGNKPVDYTSADIESVSLLGNLAWDIVERKQMEEDLRHSENYYRTIFETTGTAMCIFESDTTISLVNSNFENISGYSKQELEGKMSWIEFIHPDDLDWLKQNHYLALQDTEKAVNKFEFRCIVRNGEMRNVFMFANFVPGTNQTTASFIDITERKQMEEKLKEMSFHDSLTGLYNRNFFEEEMVRLGDGRYNPVGIVVCDLDGLKFVNDTLGHEAGDQMLIQAADILRQNFRSSDIISRIGGDEFAILLTETDSEMVEQILWRVRQAVQEYNNTEHDIPLSLSIGHAVGERETADIQAHFRKADNRMYREKLQREGSARSAILQALTVSMEARDFNTENHCNRMQELAASLARSFNLSQDVINDLYLLARFHDLGKVGIPDHILFKPGPLTDEEWQQMRQHCEIGHRIASSIRDLEPIADYILKHHERWDGLGYPLGLSGEDIPLPCRILAISDAYDAMTSDRPYRKAMTREEAISELRRFAGTQFDPNLVERFIEIVKDFDPE